MKAKRSASGRNRNSAFYLLISFSVVLSACFLSLLNRNNVWVNNTVSWISDSINSGNGYDFAKADASETSVKDHVPGGLRMEETVSLYSNYEYAVALVAPGQNTDAKVNSINPASASSSDLSPSGLMASVPADILASMSQSQIQTLSNLTSNMSQDQAIARLKEDKSFRQNIANAAGMTVSKNLSYLAAN